MTPRARNTDPDTSHAAAASVTNTAALRGALLALLDTEGPLTDHAIAARWMQHDLAVGLRVSASGLRTRRAELVTAGLVYDTGSRETLPTGRSAIVWAAGFTCPGCETQKPLDQAAEVDLQGDTWCGPCWQSVIDYPQP